MQEPFYSLGLKTLKVPLRLYEENRRRLCERLKAVMGNRATSAVVLLQGETDVPVNATDITYLFEQLREVLKKYNAEILLTLDGVNSDSGLRYKMVDFEGITDFRLDKDILFPEMSECRMYKSPLEMEIMRYVNKISSEAHKEVMKTIKPGMMEYQAESTFLNYCYKNGGCRYTGYPCICGSGENGAILHYGHAGAANEKEIRDGDMLLFDMGAEYCGYDSDITCSFPANGVFTEKQKTIYNAVLMANRAVILAARPGYNWSQMHLLANWVMLEKLKEAGLLKGEIDDMMEDSNEDWCVPDSGIKALLDLLRVYGNGDEALLDLLLNPNKRSFRSKASC